MYQEASKAQLSQGVGLFYCIKSHHKYENKDLRQSKNTMIDYLRATDEAEIKRLMKNQSTDILGDIYSKFCSNYLALLLLNTLVW
jgi:hypothetical protein